MVDKPKKVVLKIGALGTGSITVDGHELGHMTSTVQVISVPGELVRVVLDLVPDEVEVEADAEVQSLAREIQEHVAQDSGFLAAGDPLRRRAMRLRGPLGG